MSSSDEGFEHTPARRVGDMLDPEKKMEIGRPTVTTRYACVDRYTVCISYSDLYKYARAALPEKYRLRAVMNDTESTLDVEDTPIVFVFDVENSKPENEK